MRIKLVAKLLVRGYVSNAFWCAFEGKILPEAVINVVEEFIYIDISEVSISDTIGKATLDEVKKLLDLFLPMISSDRIARHFNETYGRGLENVLASWSYEISIFDSSVGALGGCPFAPGDTGNVATEAVVKALEDICWIRFFLRTDVHCPKMDRPPAQRASFHRARFAANDENQSKQTATADNSDRKVKTV